MQVIENWTDVEGTVLSMGPSQSITDYCEIFLLIEKVDDVNGYKNLLRSRSGQEAMFHISRELVRRLGISIGDHLRTRVRVAHIGKLFVHPELTTIMRPAPRDGG